VAAVRTFLTLDGNALDHDWFRSDVGHTDSEHRWQVRSSAMATREHRCPYPTAVCRLYHCRKHGTDAYWIRIAAHNFTVDQMLNVGKGKWALPWAYRYWVTRLLFDAMAVRPKNISSSQLNGLTICATASLLSGLSRVSVIEICRSNELQHRVTEQEWILAIVKTPRHLTAQSTAHSRQPRTGSVPREEPRVLILEQKRKVFRRDSASRVESDGRTT
jgi:hypothetical protein